MKHSCQLAFVENGRVVDGTGGAPIHDGVVVIEDGRISFVGERNNAPEPPTDANRIDAT